MTGTSPIPAQPAGHGRELAPGRRLFVAVPVPDAVARLVADLVDRLRGEEEARATASVGEAGRGGGRPRAGVRWVRLDDLHLTVRFLGPTAEERLPALERAISAAARVGGPFEIGIGGGGAFPTVDRPRALWLGVTDPGRGLAALASATSEALRAEGWPAEDRPYTPHLTLARTDGVRAGPRVARRLVRAAAELETWFTIDRLVLYESHTGGGRARYEPLHVARLGEG